MQITLLVGTVFGNARQIAQTLALAAPDYGASAQVLDMQDLSVAVFDTPGFLVLCCSTTGQGDVPDFYGGAKAFQNRLQDLGAQLVGEVCILDAMAADEPDAVALAWFASWAEQARRLDPSASSPA